MEHWAPPTREQLELWARKWLWYERNSLPWNRARIHLELMRRGAFARWPVHGILSPERADGSPARPGRGLPEQAISADGQPVEPGACLRGQPAEPAMPWKGSRAYSRASMAAASRSRSM